MTLSVKEIQAIESTLPKAAIAPYEALDLKRVRQIDKLPLTPREALEYALITNSSVTVAEALMEHGLNGLFAPEDPEPEDALEFAINKLPANILTTLLNAHGYQPIPKRKQALRDNAVLVKPY